MLCQCVVQSFTMAEHLKHGDERERYLYEDERDLQRYRFFLEHAEELNKDLAWVLRMRYYIALHEMGEPPLKSREQIEMDVHGMASARLGERAEWVSAHRSGVAIVFDNQELWNVTDEDELRQKMLEIIFPPDLYPTRPQTPAPSAFDDVLALDLMMQRPRRETFGWPRT